jgi:glycosyltransferase involved in cell wall biosynthesis
MSARRYCLISPCRDEARYLRRTLDAVTRQSEPPTRWVIVDDGSTDDTPAMLAEYAAKHTNVHVVTRIDRGRRDVGTGVVDAFYDGYATINPRDFDFICKLDLDLDLPPWYFATLMDRMAGNPRLGTCSGQPYFSIGRAQTGDAAFPLSSTAGLVSEAVGSENSAGMIKFYRTSCFRQIGGFVPGLMWDGIDGHRCRQLGWIAKLWDDPELRFLHLRPMGSSQKNWWAGRVRHGAGQYFMGTTPAWMLASAMYRTTRRPRVIGGAAMLYGFTKSFISRAPRYDDLEFRRFLRRYQWACLFRGKAAATDALNVRQEPVWKPDRAPRI